MALVENMMLKDRVNLLRMRAARGSRFAGGSSNLGERCWSIWYLGSLGEQEKSRRIWGASRARFTADPAATPRAKTNIVKHGGLVEEDATRVNGTCKRDLVRMEEVKGGFVLYFVRVIPEDLDDGVGRKEDVRIRTQIMDRHKCLVHWADEEGGSGQL
jgi:hypothetical protein